MPAKSLSLLAFLALEEGWHSREELAALLWGESPEAQARASLRQAIRSLRRIVPDLLEVSRTRARLRPGLSCDVHRFLEQSARDPAAAANTEVPRFLEGLHPRHAPAFEEWAEATGRMLMSRFRQALDTGGREALARQDWQGAVVFGERWLRAEPGSPLATHLLVEAQYLAGDRPGALQTWSDYASRTEGSALVPQDGPLRELVDRIASERLGERSPAGTADAAGTADRIVEAGLVGREAEWTALLQAWSATESGSGRVAVIEGEAGAGKSRLADDFCRWVQTRGGRLLRARSWETGQSTRYDTLLGMLRETLAHPGVAGADPVSLGVIARVLPEVRRRFPSIIPHEGEPGTAMLEEAVADLLLAVAEDHPLLVVVDDFQWCDAETSTVLHYLARRLAMAPVLWCVTLTLGEAAADAPALRVVRALRSLPGALRLPLPPLRVEDVWTMIRQVGRIRSETAGRRLALRTHELTGGNPFYVMELLRTWVAEGWIVAHPESGEWIVPEKPGLPRGMGTVSDSMQQAVVQRLARLPEDLHLLLLTLAAHEPGLTADVLSHVHGMSRLRLASLGDQLVARHLAAETDGVYRCQHPLTARVLRESLGEARRRELHRALALAMLAAAAERGVVAPAGDVAHHADLGGERSLAYDHALLASELSRAQGASAEALHWLDVAARHASLPAEIAVVDRATAELLEAEGAVTPRTPASRTHATAITQGDFDLGQPPPA